ncbi:TlpA disulfide reductase family protein [Pedobacter borealis]|uniref:TlpA disulfide reductase family protein n=1 Tax=Pedobacter borealis TaxID=475254 RepID=UPI0006911295|nr:TlpA disulfide reductase family protein [Pedobacter borealis]
MKKSILITLFVFAVTMVQGQTGSLFQINGSLSGMADADQVFLRYNNLGRQITDTVQVSDNSYSFTGTIYEPQGFVLWVTYKPASKKRRTESDQVNLYLTDGMINLSSSKTFNNMEMSGEGSIWNKDFNELQQQIKLSKDSAAYWIAKFQQTTNMVDAYERTIKANQKPPYSYASYKRDSTELEEINNSAFPRQKQRLHEKILIPYIRKNPSSPVSFFALRNVSEIAEERVIKQYKLSQSLFDLLSPEIKNYIGARYFSEMLAKTAKTAEGTPAPEITLPNVNGKPFSLSSLKGKYVLVHFWASWCGPCRGANPSLKKIYEKYKDKGFEILAISIDEKEAEWLKAVKEDKMPWCQVRDNKFDVSRLYQIGSIPRNFLIAADGTIITRTLEDNTLEEKLQALLGK